MLFGNEKAAHLMTAGQLRTNGGCLVAEGLHWGVAGLERQHVGAAETEHAAELVGRHLARVDEPVEAPVGDAKYAEASRTLTQSSPFDCDTPLRVRRAAELQVAFWKRSQPKGLLT